MLIGTERAGSPWENYLFARGRGGEKKKKIRPNKINHDSLGREEEWGRGKGMGGSRGVEEGNYEANKAQFWLFIGAFSQRLETGLCWVSTAPAARRTKATEITSAVLISAMILGEIRSC